MLYVIFIEVLYCYECGEQFVTDVMCYDCKCYIQFVAEVLCYNFKCFIQSVTEAMGDLCVSNVYCL